MKLLHIATAGLVMVAGIGASAPAFAQRHVVQERTVVRHGNAPRVQTRQVCNTVVRNNHRQRVCRTVRR